MTIDEQWDQSGLVGKLLAGKYLVASSLHVSPRSEVFEAEHAELGRRFAVKVLRAHPAAKALEALVGKPKGVVAFEHPSIVDIKEVGRLDKGELYVASELAPGTPLSTLIADGLAPRRALEIAKQILEALAVGHERGISHRNVCPEHVIVARGGDRIQLLGLPLAKLVTDPAESFADPNYIAPEAVSRKATSLRGDLYSVGAMLFEMLTGHPVFHAKDATALMRLHAYAAPQTLKQRAPERAFTPETEALVARALEKQPHKRFATAAEMLAAIETALDSVEAAEAAAAAATEPAPPPPADDSLLLLARDLMPAAAPSAPEPVVPVNVERKVPELPLPMRLQKKARGLVTRFRGLSRPIQLAIGAGAAVLVLTLGIVAFGGDSKPAATAPVAADVRDAEKLLARGNARGAARLLARHAKTDPVAHPKVIDLVTRILADNDTDAAAIAIGIAGQLRPIPAELILSQAASARAADVRHRAVEVADKAGLGARVDRVASWSLDLAQASDCDEQRALIGKLAGTGDKRAIAPLKKVRSNACVTDAADAALAKLAK